MHQVVLQAVAAGGEHPLIDFDLTVLLQFGLFALMAFLASKWLFKPYLKMREERTAGIDGAREEAERLNVEAATRLEEYETQLAEARAKAHEVQRKIRGEATELQRNTLDEARKKAVSAVEESRAKVQSQTEEARAELMPKADELARNMVGKLLGRQVA